MNNLAKAGVMAWLAVSGVAMAATVDEPIPGKTVDSLLAFARSRNPELASMRFEAEAATERIEPAGALPDPKLRTELMDITKSGEQNPTILPGRVESTKYTLMQSLPRAMLHETQTKIVTGWTYAIASRPVGVAIEVSGMPSIFSNERGSVFRKISSEPSSTWLDIHT